MERIRSDIICMWAYLTICIFASILPFTTLYLKWHLSPVPTLIVSDYSSQLASLIDGNATDRRLSHIVIPFHISQLSTLESNIALWGKKYVPCTKQTLAKVGPGVQLPILVFFVAHSDQIDDANVQSSLARLWDNLPTRFCFSNAIILVHHLDSTSDRHVLGARLMFEHMLRGEVAVDMSTVLYMEPDLRPIRSNWLITCMLEVAWPQSNFWVKGSIFRGKRGTLSAVSYVPNLYHINGNAFYNVGSSEFRTFYFRTLRPYIEHEHGDSLNAYDTDFFEYAMDTKNYESFRHIVHKFVYTDVILNMWHTNYSISEIQAVHPHSYLVHGGTPRA